MWHYLTCSGRIVVECGTQAVRVRLGSGRWGPEVIVVPEGDHTVNVAR